MANVKHAPGVACGGEMMVCGMAYDAFESGDSDEPIVSAKEGERVTCEGCIEAINHVRNCFTPKYHFRGYAP